MTEIEQKKLECVRCGYKWNPITDPENVKVCPRCKSYSWNMPRIRERKDSMWDDVICFKCKKPLKREDAVKGYGSYFHKNCLKTFKKSALKEVQKVTRAI